MEPNTSAATLEHLSRLASKPGVRSTLILSKSDGSLIRSSGFKPVNEIDGDEAPGEQKEQNASVISVGPSVSSSENQPQQVRGEAEEVAQKVFAFVSGAKSFAEELEHGEEVKLLRLRTKRSEIVIVPDAKFLLVVIHDTPQA